MERGETDVLERLDDSVHVSDLRRVRLEWEIDIDSSDAVSGHFCFASFTELVNVIVREKTKGAKISGEGEDAALL